jgi:hypothetical protein
MYKEITQILREEVKIIYKGVLRIENWRFIYSQHLILSLFSLWFFFCLKSNNKKEGNQSNNKKERRQSSKEKFVFCFSNFNQK